MKDDSLSDVQKTMTVDEMTAWAVQLFKDSKLFVERMDAVKRKADADRSAMFEDSAKQSVHGVEVWNAAIEAAAKAAMNAPIFPKGYGSSERDGRIIVMMDIVMTEIRKLKK